MGATQLKTYENVAISTLDFDGSSFDKIPRALLQDWVDLVARVARILKPDFVAGRLPDPLQFQMETISSDGPYGSSENFYYLNYYFMELEGVRIAFESGRQEGDEPLGVEIKGLLSSYLPPRAGPSRARFFVWQEESHTAAIEAILGPGTL